MLSLKADNRTISHIGDKCKKSAEGDKTILSLIADNLGAPDAQGMMKPTRSSYRDEWIRVSG